MATVLGFVIKPLRLEYAVHDHNLIGHVEHIKDGQILVPSSMRHSELNHRTILMNQELPNTFDEYLEDPSISGFIAAANLKTSYHFTDSVKYIEKALTDYFADHIGFAVVKLPPTRTMGKMCNELYERIPLFKGKYILANYVAYQGGKHGSD